MKLWSKVLYRLCIHESFIIFCIFIVFISLIFMFQIKQVSRRTRDVHKNTNVLMIIYLLRLGWLFEWHFSFHFILFAKGFLIQRELPLSHTHMINVFGFNKTSILILYSSKYYCLKIFNNVFMKINKYSKNILIKLISNELLLGYSWANLG